MTKHAFSARFFRALPYLYMGAGVLLMVALRSQLAVLGGLILVAVGGIELLRRARFGREKAATESRMDTRMRADREGHSTQALMQISWRESFECGHPLIDEQHRSLFKIGDGLVNAVLKNKSRNHIEFLLDELTKHIEAHFMTEEAAMARTRFPLSDEHREHHRELLERARALRADYREGKLDVSELVGFVVYDVITEHIIREDLKFALRDTQPAAI